MLQIVPVDQLADFVGKDLGESDWFTVDQDRINAFADATNDHQFIHIDPEAAKATPWGTTIAHGFLSLSLLPFLTASAGIIPEGMIMAINYGLDKVRFIEPVRVGSEVRAKAQLAEVTVKGPGRYLLKTNVTVEINGSEKPALIAETLSMFIVP